MNKILLTLKISLVVLIIGSVFVAGNSYPKLLLDKCIDPLDKHPEIVTQKYEYKQLKDGYMCCSNQLINNKIDVVCT